MRLEGTRIQLGYILTQDLVKPYCPIFGFTQGREDLTHCNGLHKAPQYHALRANDARIRDGLFLKHPAPEDHLILQRDARGHLAAPLTTQDLARALRMIGLVQVLYPSILGPPQLPLPPASAGPAASLRPAASRHLARRCGPFLL